MRPQHEPRVCIIFLIIQWLEVNYSAFTTVATPQLVVSYSLNNHEKTTFACEVLYYASHILSSLHFMW